jgi:hypothetical protein
MAERDDYAHLRELFGVELAALDRHFTDLLDAMRELRASERAGDLQAVEKALTAAKEVTTMHNGLLRKMEVLVETFLTKLQSEATQRVTDGRLSRLEGNMNRIIGGLMLLSGLGVANFVRAWFG